MAAETTFRAWQIAGHISRLRTGIEKRKAALVEAQEHLARLEALLPAVQNPRGADTQDLLNILNDAGFTAKDLSDVSRAPGPGRGIEEAARNRWAELVLLLQYLDGKVPGGKDPVDWLTSYLREDGVYIRPLDLVLEGREDLVRRMPKEGDLPALTDMDFEWVQARVSGTCRVEDWNGKPQILRAWGHPSGV